MAFKQVGLVPFVHPTWKETCHWITQNPALFTCPQVQLLVTSQDVDNYKQIKSDLDQLRSIVEKSELWVYKRQGEDGMDGDGPSESDSKKKV